MFTQQILRRSHITITKNSLEHQITHPENQNAVPSNFLSLHQREKVTWCQIQAIGCMFQSLESKTRQMFLNSLGIVSRSMVKMQHDFRFMHFSAVWRTHFHQRLNETSYEAHAITFVSLWKNRDLALTSSIEKDCDHSLLLEL
jgi:hypothetical protein